MSEVSKTGTGQKVDIGGILERLPRSSRCYVDGQESARRQWNKYTNVAV